MKCKQTMVKMFFFFFFYKRSDFIEAHSTACSLEHSQIMLALHESSGLHKLVHGSLCSLCDRAAVTGGHSKCQNIENQIYFSVQFLLKLVF